MHFRICCNSLTSLRFVFSSSYSPVDWAFSSSNSFCHSDTLKDFVPSGRFACRKRLAAFQIMRSLSWACSNFLSFAPSVFQRFQFIVNGLQAVVVAAMLDKLFQCPHALLLGNNACIQPLCFFINRGKGSVQIFKGSNALALQIDNRLADFCNSPAVCCCCQPCEYFRLSLVQCSNTL